MSFVMPSQRGFQHVNQSDLEDVPIQNHNTRMQMSPSSYDEYHSSALPDSSLPPPRSPVQNGAQSAYATDQPHVQLPKVGQTRCYWTLLSADLHFIYLDPVLANHLEDQADILVGKSLLAFVHPDEQASAKHDLGSVLESRTLHGSVTRVRYSRLSKVRRDLGHQGSGVNWTDAEKIALDANYMACDIVINWAAQGLVLCFIHAAVDLSPGDNDEQQKTDWTNWCGTPYMPVDQIGLLYQRLLVCIPQTGSMSRVFQILSNQQDRPLLMSWPPDQQNGPGPTGRDYAKLVENVQIGTATPHGNDAKTSCTRRYKALQSMPSFLGEIESIFIPHGTVIFACHKVSTPSRSTSTAPVHGLSYNPINYVSHHNQEPYGTSYPMPPPLNSNPNPYTYIPPHSHHVPPQYSPHHWSQGSDSHQPQYGSWNSPSPSHSLSPLPPPVGGLRSGSYPPSQHWPAQPSSYADSEHSPTQSFQRPLSPGYGYHSAGGSDGASPSASHDVVPPPRRRVSPGNTREQFGSSSRGAGNRPMGVLKCSSCRATQSPEWRKGPSGKKELCNACGLRYARSRAKKEGSGLTQRRRKDKGLALNKRESATPPISGSPTYSGLRRHFADEGPFMSSSPTGSASGSEVYSHSQQSHSHSHSHSHPAQPSMDGMTPSPSPPASNMSFVHYAPHLQHGPNQPGESRPPYSSGSGPFYSVPSPLSNQPLLHGHNTHPPVPRLEHIPQYSGRLSPTQHSPMTSTMPLSSFEREKNRDRELPPTPVSASPRHPRRSILSQT